MKITIHVGQGKTGTSSIQDFLAFNFGILLKNKILYSMFLNEANKQILKGFGDERLMNLQQPELVKQKMELLNDFLVKHDMERFIWSLESLFTHSLEEIQQIKNYLEFDEIEIIVFLRRQDSWFQSAFYQWGWKHKTYEGRYLIDFENFYKIWQDKGYYDRFVENWAKVFGEENIKIQPFEKKQLPNGLIQSFCRLINLEIPGLDKTERIKYSSFDHYTSQIIGICNSLNEGKCLNVELVELLNRNLRENYPGATFRNHSLISPKRSLEILDKYEASNQIVAKKYLKREDGILFFEPKPNADEEWKPFEPMSLEHFIPIIFDILLSQEKRIRNLEKQAQRIIKGS
jgi:hypothetical protein